MGKAVAAGNGSQADRPGRLSAVGIVGAGSIGVAWALVFGRAGFSVRLYDPDAGRRAAVPAELASRLAALAAESLLTEPAAEIGGRVCVTDDLAAAVAGVSYVQECAPEALPLKRELFGQLDSLAAADVVLASSSSALTASKITAGLAGAHRCLIAHPGNPPYLLPVVELVPGGQTAPAAMDAAEDLMRRAGMTPVGCDVSAHDILAIGAGFGCATARAASPDQLQAAVAEALAVDRPTLIEVAA